MKTHLLSLAACLLPVFLWGKGEVVYTRLATCIPTQAY